MVLWLVLLLCPLALAFLAGESLLMVLSQVLLLVGKLLALLLGLFAYLWYRGHLQAFRKYVMETRDQLRKCTWPTRDELYQHTVVVFLSTLMMGLFTVLADQAAALLVWDILLQVPTSMFGKLFGAGV